MRLISANLFLGEREQARRQAAARKTFLAEQPFDTSYNERTSDSVLALAEGAEPPRLRWR